VLKKIDSHHPLKADRRPSGPSFRIEGLDHAAQTLPWNDLVHRRKKRCPKTLPKKAVVRVVLA
jgi:hypothetical protein